MPASGEVESAPLAAVRVAAAAGLVVYACPAQREPAAPSPTSASVAMHAYVYKSLRKADTYVYLADREGGDALPAPVRDALGALEFVLEVDLAPGRRLARVDAQQVREALATRGFFVQVPPPPDGAAYDATEFYRSRDA